MTKCPLTAPVHCSNGNCAKSVIECEESTEMLCPIDEPILCVTGECKKYPHECSFESIFNIPISNTRLL